MLESAGIPVVEIMDTDGEAIDSVVGISHRAAGRTMAEAIVAAGYRRIGFLGTKMPDDHRARKRMEGLVEGLAEHGLELAATEFYSGGSALQKGREMTEAILQAHPRPRLPLLFERHDRRGRADLVPRTGARHPRKAGPGRVQRARIPRRAAEAAGHHRRLPARDRRARGAHHRRAGDGRVIGGVRVELTPTLQPGDTIRRR
jgi:LacI family transcriptional regulator, gluconate utilization system Gnt-I transcriptional repressor